MTITRLIIITSLIAIIIIIIISFIADDSQIDSLNSPTLYIHRHGYRLDFADDATGQNRWRNSARFAENSRDPPLLDANEAGIEENAKLIKGISAIYSSPFTRCIQTSIILANELNVPIYIEYGLAEQEVSDSRDNHDGHDGQIVVNRANMDAKLAPDAIKSRFPQVNINNSIYDLEDVMSTHETSENIIKRNTDIIRQLRARHKHVLIVAHCGQLYLTAMMCGGNPKEIMEKVCATNQTGTLVHCWCAMKILTKNIKYIKMELRFKK